MKKIVLASLMMVCLPYWAMSQSVDDDLYFIPKKKAEKKEEVKQEVKVVVPQKQNTTTVYAAPGSTVVVKDVKGKVRDVDEYNRRYTSRDNNFSIEDLIAFYKEQKPLGECVLVIEGRSRKEMEQESQESWKDISIEDHMAIYENQGIARKEAMKMVAKDRGVTKRDIYQALLLQK